MTEFARQLWPELADQPTYDLEVDGQVYHLTWDNTVIRTYRTGMEEFDQELKKFSHIVHEIKRDGLNSDYAWFTLDAVEEDVLDHLTQNAYPTQVKPKLDDYVLERMADTQSTQVPDAIGPEFSSE